MELPFSFLFFAIVLTLVAFDLALVGTRHLRDKSHCDRCRMSNHRPYHIQSTGERLCRFCFYTRHDYNQQKGGN